MKTVSGEVISSKSISLKKAAKTLSRFASSDNGASPAFAVYLRRASAAFDELVQLHKETKLPGSAHKDKKRRSKDVSEGTYESAMSSGDKGLMEEKDVNKRKESRGVNKGEGEDDRSIVRTEARKVQGNVEGNVSMNETESFDGSKDTRKKKRDKLGTEKHDIAVDIDRKRESFPNNENAGNDQAIDTGKKHGSKQKKNREQSYRDHAPIVTNDEIESIDQSKEIKKKKKNKKQNDDDKQSTETVNDGGNNKYGQPSGTRDTYVADVNTTDSVDDSKKPRKKNKRDNHDNINSGEVIYKDKEMHGEPSTKEFLNNETAQVVKNAVDDQKKRKKNRNKNEMKEERFDGDINSDERRYESNKLPGNVENAYKKKETYEGKERKKEGKLENEGANNNESRKRKHESVAAGESNDSQEHHKLKKKKR